ncbi:hypothetical protein LINGRAHAP2_LOCUS36538 [Linum grandiflorum]
MNYGDNNGGRGRPSAAVAEEVLLVIDDDDEECFTTAASTPPPRWIDRVAAEEDDESGNWCLSPVSRAMEIARGQRELMDMIRTMPEDFYELSLKDLVDHHHREINPNRVEERLPEANSSNGGGEVSRRAESVKKADENPAPAKMKRSGSVNFGSGFLLRLPISYLRSRSKKKKMVKKRKKKGVIVDGGGGKVSPKPAEEAGERGRSSSAFSGGESRSSKGSSSRGSWRNSSNRNSIRRKSGARWCLFFSSSKGKVVE